MTDVTTCFERVSRFCAGFGGCPWETAISFGSRRDARNISYANESYYYVALVTVGLAINVYPNLEKQKRDLFIGLLAVLLIAG